MSINTDEKAMRVFLKRNRLLLGAGILLLVFGLWIDVQWFSAKPSPTLYLINLLPGLLLIFVWYRASKTVDRRWSVIVLGVLITLVVSFFVVFLNLSAGAFLASTTTITDVSQYDEIRQQMGDSELTQHFPSSIPENASDVKFEYLPKFLQGGAHIQLRLQLPQNEIADLLKEYRSKAKFNFVGGDRYEHSNEPSGVPTTYFHTSGIDDRSFPDTYEIFVLNAQPGGTPDFQWNHGYSYGVVISLEKSEIIYWAEYW